MDEFQGTLNTVWGFHPYLKQFKHEQVQNANKHMSENGQAFFPQVLLSAVHPEAAWPVMYHTRGKAKPCSAARPPEGLPRAWVFPGGTCHFMEKLTW